MTKLTNDNKSEPREVTLEDLARKLGLGKATVSCALSGKGRVAEKTRELVLSTAQEMGFQPNPHARQLTNGRATDTVALFARAFDLGVATNKLQLMQMLLMQEGFRAPLHICGLNSKDDITAQREVLGNLRRQRPAGIICHTSGLRANALEELVLFQEQGGHAICYDLEVSPNCDQVIFDRKHNTYLATRHLLELGHREIALYAGWGTPHRFRLEGYLQALEEFGVVMRPEWLIPGESEKERGPIPSNIQEANGARLVDFFLEISPRPTAIAIVNDSLASAFVTELMRRGIRIPNDVSVVGHDNLPVGAFVCPVPLTTASQPVETIAQTVVRFLTERIRGEYTGEARRTTVQGELLVRKSTAPPYIG